MQQYVIGIDIGGTNFRIGMVSQDGSLQNFEKHSSSVLVTGNAVEILSKQIDIPAARAGRRNFNWYSIPCK